MNTIYQNLNYNNQFNPVFNSKEVPPQNLPRTREEAKALGLKRYRPSVPCRNGHDDGRYVSDNACVQCRKLRSRKWERENPEKRRETKRKQMRAYRAARTDEMAAWAAWNSARSRGATVPEGVAIAEVVKATIPLYRKSRMLSEATGIRHEVDHIVPINRGGIHALENLQIVSRTFNAAKRYRTNNEVLAEVIAGEWRFGVSPELLKIAKDHLEELIENHEELDSVGILAAQGFIHRIEVDPDYRPSLEVIRAVFERLQGEHRTH